MAVIKANSFFSSTSSWCSKTYLSFFCIALMIGGVITWAMGEIAAGSIITIPALLNTLLRVISKQEIKF